MASNSSGAQVAATASQQSQPQTGARRLVVRLADGFTGLLRRLRYAYLIRVPLIIAAILFGFPFAALLRKSPLRDLFQNLFLLGTGTVWPTFFSTVAALVLAWSLLLTARIVLLNCCDRFNVPSQLEAGKLTGKAFFSILLLSLPMLLGQFTQQDDFRVSSNSLGQCVLGMVAGGVFAYVLTFCTLWVAVLLAPPKTQGSALTFPCFRFMHKWLVWADDHHILPAGIGPGLWIRDHLPAPLWEGYLAFDGFLWSGHWLALVFGTASFMLYLAIGWIHGNKLGNPAPYITALTFVLLLLLNLNWSLSFLAFFLDRFRIPVIVPLVLLAVVSGNQRITDHYYRIGQLSPGSVATSPGQVLEGRIRAGKPIVVITTAGGGIQAAAWTMQVLGGLEGQFQKWYPGKTFAEYVTAISSISGGATGSMYYMSAFDNTLPAQVTPRQLRELRDAAWEQSLDDVAWAMVYHDLPRIIFPFAGSRLHDRGYALEEGWSLRAHLDQGDRMLADWRKGVEDGRRPVIIFNSTIAERGEPLAFATTKWEESLDTTISNGSVQGGRAFYDMYSGDDVRVATAVRLAASFPFVSPAARPDTGQPGDFHMIDGGYYDNYGVTSLLAWLGSGLKDLLGECQAKLAPGQPNNCGSNLPPILIIQIRSFPADKEAKATPKGWAYQSYAPVQGLVSVRSTGQLIRDQEALQLFDRAWDPTGFATLQPGKARIQFATFEFGGFGPKGEEGQSNVVRRGMTLSPNTIKAKAVNPPLSWAMNQSQKDAVREDWESRVDQQNPTQNDPNIAAIHAFFDRYLR